MSSAPADSGTFAVKERLEVVDSTNRYLVDLISAGLADGGEVPEGYAVTAERQTAGRGRLGRRWEAPPGSSVLCSMLFRPLLVAEQLHLVTWAVALAAAAACGEVAGVEPTLKWPNDLLIGHRKVAGLLAEVVAGRQAAPGRADGPVGLVVGIGINVNWPDGWPEQSGDRQLASDLAEATSIGRAAGQVVDRHALTTCLVERTGERYLALGSARGQSELASAYRRRCSTIGREVRVQLADETFTGTAADVDDGGHLLVDVGTCLRAVAAGDVLHLR